MPRLSTPGVSADSNGTPWRILPLRPLYFMALLYSGWVPELCVDQATEAGLEDTWFAEPKGFMWYLVLSSSAPQRWKWFMSTGSSRDLDMQQTPLTGTERIETQWQKKCGQSQWWVQIPHVAWRSPLEEIAFLWIYFSAVYKIPLQSYFYHCPAHVSMELMWRPTRCQL